MGGPGAVPAERTYPRLAVRAGVVRRPRGCAGRRATGGMAVPRQRPPGIRSVAQARGLPRLRGPRRPRVSRDPRGPRGQGRFAATRRNDPAHKARPPAVGEGTAALTGPLGHAGRRAWTSPANARVGAEPTGLTKPARAPVADSAADSAKAMVGPVVTGPNGPARAGTTPVAGSDEAKSAPAAVKVPPGVGTHALRTRPDRLVVRRRVGAMTEHHKRAEHRKRAEHHRLSHPRPSRRMSIPGRCRLRSGGSCVPCGFPLRTASQPTWWRRGPSSTATQRPPCAMRVRRGSWRPGSPPAVRPSACAPTRPGNTPRRSRSCGRHAG